jgi:Cu/Ag efflux protein CusF
MKWILVWSCLRMAHQGWVAVSCLALTFLWACGNQAGQKPSNATPASGPAAAVQSNQYKGVGVVKAVNPKAPAIEIDHGDIEGLMPAMQMEFPVTDPNLLNGIAVNDRIDFTIENAPEGMKVVAIKKL